MTNQANITISLAIALGILGGMCSHFTWLIATMRKLAEQNKSFSVAKKAIQTRMALFFLSAGLGLASGFIAGLISKEFGFSLGVTVGFAFTSGYAVDSLISKIGNSKSD